jgi:hypothetical protein
MAMTISTVHKGHNIVFDEVSEMWECPDLNRSDSKLSSLKRYLDNLGKSERTVNVEALKLGQSSVASVERVTVTVICEPSNPSKESSDCWIKSKYGREKILIGRLAPLDQSDKADAWIEASKETQLAREAERRAGEAIGRFSAKSLFEAAAKSKVTK